MNKQTKIVEKIPQSDMLLSCFSLARKQLVVSYKPHSEKSYAPSRLQSTVFSHNLYRYFFRFYKSPSVMNWNLINCLVPWFPMPWLFPRCFQKTFFPFISFCTKNTSLKRRNGWRKTQNESKVSLEDVTWSYFPKAKKTLHFQRNFPTYPSHLHSKQKFFSPSFDQEHNARIAGQML